jgi:hypothetical protein
MNSTTSTVIDTVPLDRPKSIISSPDEKLPASAPKESEEYSPAGEQTQTHVEKALEDSDESRYLSGRKLVFVFIGMLLSCLQMVIS